MLVWLTAFAGGGDGGCPCVDHLHEDGDELGRAHVVAVLLEVLVQAVDCATNDNDDSNGQNAPDRPTATVPCLD